MTAVGASSRVWARKGWHEASSVLRTHNHRRYRTKFSRHGACRPDTCTAAIWRRRMNDDRNRDKESARYEVTVTEKNI